MRAASKIESVLVEELQVQDKPDSVFQATISLGAVLPQRSSALPVPNLYSDGLSISGPI